jgi:hypothetical protein
VNAEDLRAASLRLLAEAEAEGHAAALRCLLESPAAGLDYGSLAQVFGTAEAVCKRLAALRGLPPEEAGRGAAGAGEVAPLAGLAWGRAKGKGPGLVGRGPRRHARHDRGGIGRRGRGPA